jgi:hypothetical protein
MDRWIRRLLERTLADRVAVGNATKPSQVRALLQLLKPVPQRAGLQRFGPPGDGGYLMPDDLDGIAACISPGVSAQCGFDEAMAARGMDVYMADASVSGPPVPNPAFHFTPKFLDVWSSPQTMTLAEQCVPVADGDLLLQMDIEGAEYRVLAATPDELLRRFRIMIVEFHDLDAMFSRFGYSILQPVFAKLTAHHSVVHIHPNNCIAPVKRFGLSVPPIMEFTFYRNDRIERDGAQALTFPHPLDATCMPMRSDVELPACWWQGA